MLLLRIITSIWFELLTLVETADAVLHFAHIYLNH